MASCSAELAARAVQGSFIQIATSQSTEWLPNEVMMT